MATANKIIKSALRKLLVVSQGKEPSDREYSEGLETLNDLITTWSANANLIYEDTLEEFPLKVGVQQVTFGESGDFITGKIEDVVSASMRISGYEYPLLKGDKNVYASIQRKTNNGNPTYYYLRNTHPNSTIYFDRTLNQEAKLLLNSVKSLKKFPDGTTDIKIPDYYESAFKHNLVIHIAAESGAAKRVSPIMLDLARESKEAVIGRSVRISPSTTELTYINGYVLDRIGHNQDSNR